MTPTGTILPKNVIGRRRIAVRYTDSKLPGVKNLSLFAANATIAALFGRTLTHLHRKDLSYEGNSSNQDDDTFWRRHRYLDTVLLHTLQYLPDDLRIRSGISSPQIVLLHINIQASTICLHQAAVFRAQKTSPTPQIDATVADSKARCLHATESMMTILRLLDPAVLQNVRPLLYLSLVHSFVC